MDNQTSEKELVRRNAPMALRFTKGTLDLIKKQVAIGATDDEFLMFIYQAQRTGLDPLAKQIYFIKRKTKVKKFDEERKAYVETYEYKPSIQASIDGLRVVAQRSKEYAGQDEPVFETDKSGKLVRCTVIVYKFNPKTGERYPAAHGVAYFSEYVPTTGQDFMWTKMPHTMLAKVAEALALRKAFPQDLSGLYTQEEMKEQQVIDNVIVESQEQTVTPVKTLPAAKEIKKPVAKTRIVKGEITKVKTFKKPLTKKEVGKKYKAVKKVDKLEQEAREVFRVPPESKTVNAQVEEKPDVKPISFGQKVLIGRMIEQKRIKLTPEQMGQLSFEAARDLISQS